MEKISKAEFLARFAKACDAARVCEPGTECMRIAIYKAELPVPELMPDAVLKHPIYDAVVQCSRTTYGPLPVLKTMALAETAWEHFQKFPDATGVRGGARYE